MIENKSVKDHDKLVRELRGQIDSLGLFVWRRSGVFSKGFIPDIVTNVGGTVKDWVIIDVINTPNSLKRDIGGLLVVKANAEAVGYSIRGIIGVCSNRIDSVENYNALIKQYPNFWLIRQPDFEWFLRSFMYQSAREKVEKRNDDILEIAFKIHSTKQKRKTENKKFFNEVPLAV